MVAAVDDDGENGDISGVDAGDASGLSQCFWAMRFQLLSAFEAQSRDLIVV